MRVSSLSDIGLVRKTNEDNHLVQKEKGLFIVADGMGGHKGGQLASTLAIQTIEGFLQSEDKFENKGVALCLALKAANEKIFREAAISDNQGMGTTVTAMKILNSRAYIAHIGDSRAYLIRNNQISLITNDHSLVGELIRSGEITQEEALVHPHRNVLIRALGTEVDVDVDLIELDLLPNDILLLCTDGLSNFVRDEEILKIITQHSIHESTRYLVKRAIELGGLDNITVVLVHYEG
jgi:serine/threonine protein phosphatase PrpC